MSKHEQLLWLLREHRTGCDDAADLIEKFEQALAAAEARFSSERAQYEITKGLLEQAEATIAAMKRDWEILTAAHDKIHEAWEQSKGRVLEETAERMATESLLNLVKQRLDEEKARCREQAEQLADANVKLERTQDNFRRMTEACEKSDARSRELEAVAYEALGVSPENQDTAYGEFAKTNPVLMLVEAYRAAREQGEQLAAKDREIERLRGIIYRNCSSVHCAIGDSRPIEDIVMADASEAAEAAAKGASNG